MPHSDTLAAAAHLHVLLRRKTGRVTDTEWMASNAEYARAMIAFARASAAENGHEDLLPLAARVEELMHLAPPPPAPEPPVLTSPIEVVAAPADEAAKPKEEVSNRYVGRLR